MKRTKERLNSQTNTFGTYDDPGKKVVTKLG